ncbi:hypothetical protein Cgig2_027000 [Carnegiea gigantea]|uniref:Uncharacterized protein n=1 Tax=Carnegiea gigantea TaxID=171969 RepID=A0A9Q1JVS0_9CARY|nr:hypothetical protein Cgig2_027000 [Carnegiea gigantea]
MGNLNVIAEGELAAFSTFWLSRFFFALWQGRPETFVMAALTASGQGISLALTVLGYIYHGLQEVVSHRDHPDKANKIFPSHYVIGWLAKFFHCLYHHSPDSDCPGDFLILFVMLGCLVANFHYPMLDMFAMMGDIFFLKASSYHDDSHNGRDIIDMGLPDEDFKFLFSIWSSILPPNQLAYQFGFDQGVPSNRLSFIRAL